MGIELGCQAIFRLISNDTAAYDQLHNFHDKDGRRCQIHGLTFDVTRPRHSHQQDQSNHLCHQQKQSSVLDQSIRGGFPLLFLDTPSACSIGFALCSSEAFLCSRICPFVWNHLFFDIVDDVFGIPRRNVHRTLHLCWCGSNSTVRTVSKVHMLTGPGTICLLEQPNKLFVEEILRLLMPNFNSFISVAWL